MKGGGPGRTATDRAAIEAERRSTGGEHRGGAAERKRRQRARQSRGLAVLHVEVPFFETSEALVEAGYLAAWDAENPVAVARALEAMVAYLAGVGHA